MDKFNVDKPISRAEEDKFQREYLAEQVARAIASYHGNSSLVIGVYGPWGCGKTSFVNLILNHLDDSLKITFNPWMCANTHQMVKQFFNQLSNEIIKSINLNSNKEEGQYKIGEGFKSLCNKLIRYGELLEPAVRLGSLFVDAALGTIISTGCEQTIKFAKNIVCDNSNRNHPVDLMDLKNQINSDLIKYKLKLIVHVDDIDRLQMMR